MTGYSSLRGVIGEAMVSIEIKTLNHKQQDVHYHSPRTLSMLELPIRERLLKTLRRGRIEVFIRVNGALTPQDNISVNQGVAQAYLNAARQLAETLKLDYQPRLETILAFNGVVEADDAGNAPEQVWPRLQEMLDESLQNLIAMKTSEGERLMTELNALLDKMLAATEAIEPLRDVVVTEYREKLLARIQEWEKAPDLDPNRVAQEIAFFADRSDIQEEMVRLKSHIQQFREILNENQGGDYQAVGRRLDFLCQELFREANTIGSKSSSLAITQKALELKGTIEQLREQVQNIE